MIAMLREREGHEQGGKGENCADRGVYGRSAAKKPPEAFCSSSGFWINLKRRYQRHHEARPLDILFVWPSAEGN
ncbi:hypothetical protein T11_13259 [Trichinella zimbabwensis]|uniref:Uncharacterized protein n=1 Tax=Trichinella zimbabwensis TaxID=268475 RepID=A0A0V1GTQ2_9BILA|nr:hypothetical protein T11_13259 [Trichinella zimbabwensis]